MGLTLTQFRAAVAANVGLNNSATPPGDQTNIDRWLNDGIAEICARARCNVQVFTTTFTANDYDYTLSASLLAINEVYVTDASNSVRYRLVRCSPQEILNYRVGTQFVGAPPVRFYAVDGFRLLMVYPTPTAADTLTIYGVPRPTALSAGSDTNTDIPDEWQNAIEYYATWQAARFINDAASQNGATWKAMYEETLRDLKKAANKMGGRRMSKAVVGNLYGDRRPIGRPDQTYV